MAKTKLYIFYKSLYGAPTKHMVKMAGYIDANFKLRVREMSEIRTSLSQCFTKEVLQLPG